MKMKRVVDLLLIMVREDYLRCPIISWCDSQAASSERSSHAWKIVHSMEVSFGLVPYKEVKLIKLFRFMLDNLFIALLKFYFSHMYVILQI